MIRQGYIYGNREDIDHYTMYKEDQSFFREEFESLDYFSRRLNDAIFFNESTEDIELISESATDIIRTIGNKIIEIVNKVRDFIKGIFQKIKTASWEGKSDQRKLELLAKKNPELAKRTNIAIKEGKLNLNDFKDLNTFYRTIDEVLAEIDKGDVNPKSLKAKLNKAKEKFNKNADSLKVVAGVAGSVVTIYKFAQLFRKSHGDNDTNLEKMRDVAEVQANKLERMGTILANHRNDKDVENLRSKSAILAYATTQYEQVTNSAISARSKMKFSLIKAYDSAINILTKKTGNHDDAYNSAMNELRDKHTASAENMNRYQHRINNRRHA